MKLRIRQLIIIVLLLLSAYPGKAASDTLTARRSSPVKYGSLRFGAGGFKAINAEIGYGFLSSAGLLRYGTIYSELTVEFNKLNRSTLWGPKVIFGATNTFSHKSNYEAGGNLCFILYCKENELTPAVRPEAVISFGSIFDLSYGYNFYLGAVPGGVSNTHVITLIMRPKLVLELMRADHH